MQTCLQIVQTACKRIGINSPNAAVTSSDLQVIQLLALLEETGQELADRYGWQTLQKEATFTTVATETQKAVSTITTGFNYIVNDTIWNRTLRRPVYGPKSQQDWQQAKAININGPFNSFRIEGDNILFNPVPAAGQSCYFEYITKNWLTLSVGGTSDSIANDADTPLLDDKILTLGLIWRWKAAKGLDYSEDFEKYESKVTDAQVRDAGKPTLNLTGGAYEIQPVVMVPRGSW
jgi:hypothetical protein